MQRKTIKISRNCKLTSVPVPPSGLIKTKKDCQPTLLWLHNKQVPNSSTLSCKKTQPTLRAFFGHYFTVPSYIAACFLEHSCPAVKNKEHTVCTATTFQKIQNPHGDTMKKLLTSSGLHALPRGPAAFSHHTPHSRPISSPTFFTVFLFLMDFFQHSS